MAFVTQLADGITHPPGNVTLLPSHVMNFPRVYASYT